MIENGAVSSTTTINVTPITFNGVSVAPLEASLAIQSILSGGFTETGGGVLQLNAQDLYSGETVISAGSMLTIGVQNAGSRFSQLDLMAGTILNLAGASTVWGSMEGSGTVFNSLAGITTNGASTATLTVGLDNTTTTFSGAFSRNNDATPADVSVTKVGTGTMYLTGTANLTSTATLAGTASTGALTVEQGLVVYGDPATGAGTGGFQTTALLTGGALTLDNSILNINNRLNGSVGGAAQPENGTATQAGEAAGSEPAEGSEPKAE